MTFKLVMAAAIAAGTLGAASDAAEARPGGYYDYAPQSCGALIRSAGKKNLVRLFARNSAVFAWKREAKYVYGPDHGYWREARAKRVECHREGLFTRCVAKAHPCERY